MTVFIALAALAGIATVIALLWPLLAGSGTEAGRAARDAQIYRDQLAELERDRAAGLISEAEAAGTRAEIARKLIAADHAARREAGFGPAPRSVSARAVGAAAVGLPAAAALIYAFTGEFGREDAPFAGRSLAEQRAAVASLPGQRLTQAEAEELAAERGMVPSPEIDPQNDPQAELVARLEEVVAGRPEDVEGRQLLADAHMRRGRFAEAAEVLAEIIRLEGPRAGAGLFTQRAEALVLAAGGYVSEEAEKAIRTAIRLDGDDPMARYYTGLALAQAGRTDQAIALWEGLRARATPDAPWLPLVDAALTEARMRRAMAEGGGAMLPGPGAEEMAAASEMSPEERAEMIRGMVDGLEARLEAEGGSPEEWVRLISSRMRLGQEDAARRAYELSQDSLTGSEAGFVRERALVLGVIED